MIIDNGNKIALIWAIEDVQSMRPDLSPEQAREVLLQVLNDHDASLGINWDTLEWTACDLFGPRPEEVEE